MKKNRQKKNLQKAKNKSNNFATGVNPHTGKTFLIVQQDGIKFKLVNNYQTRVGALAGEPGKVYPLSRFKALLQERKEQVVNSEERIKELQAAIAKLPVEITEDLTAEEVITRKGNVKAIKTFQDKINILSLYEEYEIDKKLAQLCEL